MQPSLRGPTQNQLLLALCGEERARLGLKLQCAALSLGQVLREPGRPVEHVYFPTSSVISFLYTMQDGSTAEMGLVGNDGVAGIEVFLGGQTTPHRAVVQIAGEAWRIPATLFQGEVARSASMERILLRYTQALLTQISQTAVCNRLHCMAQRLCRWLLMCHDRVGKDEFVLTHEFLAEMLGVRRQTVTAIAGMLQTASLISYRRGVLRILNRKKLEAASCECYEVAKAFYDRIMQ